MSGSINAQDPSNGDELLVTWSFDADRRLGDLIAAAAAGFATAVSGEGLRDATGDLQRWVVACPCPDLELRRRLELLVARCGYLVLVTSGRPVGKEAVNRVDELHDELVAFRSDLAKLTTAGRSASVG